MINIKILTIQEIFMDITIRCCNCNKAIKGYGLDKIDTDNILEEFGWVYSSEEAKFYCQDCKK